jgi:hypothetical protein
MPDLIDREEAKLVIERVVGPVCEGVVGKALLRGIDAAPTISCAECEHVRPWSFDDIPLLSCQHESSPFLDCDVAPDFGCSNFERRQP